MVVEFALIICRLDILNKYGGSKLICDGDDWLSH